MAELLFREDAYLRACEAVVTRVDDTCVELSRTVFYPAGGGQAGDSGTLMLADGHELRISDARKGQGADEVVHLIDTRAFVESPPVPGMPVKVSIDWSRRYRLMRLHTCMHLLCAIVPAPVTGGSIGAERAHLDFDIEMEKLRKEEIEVRLNALTIE